MTFDQLIVFQTIVKTGSFKAAAAQLHKTQPAISVAIKKLEEELEVSLFDRSEYRPKLTNWGKIFNEKLQKVMQGMDELEQLSQSFRQKEEPEISISVDGISINHDMLKIFKDFSDHYPNTKLNLNFDILSETERKVFNQEADIGITHFLQNKAQLDIYPLTTIRMLPVMNRELFKQKKINSLAQLREIDQIVIGDKLGPQGASFGLLEEGKKWRLLDNKFKNEIILAGLGWGHLPEQTIIRDLKEKKLVVLKFESIGPKVIDVNLIKLKKKQLGPVSKNLWKALIESMSKQ
jgi:DNA-binding transcriptional LysR family regulator